eukprot:PRCOL_00003310-RA
MAVRVPAAALAGRAGRAGIRERRARAAAIGPRGGVGLETAATVAVAAATEVASAVRMRGVDAPDVGGKTFVAMGESDDDDDGDVSGLPRVYDRNAIEEYWRTQGGALQQRWSEFVRLSVPLLTRVVALGIKGGADELAAEGASLARQARLIMEELGPTYIKAGQMMSVRPDVLPQVALDELAALQDSVQPFETRVAIETIEAELGAPLGAAFSEISEEPVAAASLAQVHKAKLADSGEWVAVKVQRPAVLETVSKDLYVLRRAAEVYQGLIERFAPQQRTNYVGLLNEWAVGFYTELDFQNEANNQTKIRRLLAEEGVEGVYVPRVYDELCTRRLLVTEWVDGKKLSECEPEEIRALVAVGQECFLTQLLQVGFFHSDPHPGNILRMDDASKGKIALIDFGLVATIEQEDMDTMVSSIVHLANKDYAALVDDFIALEILPADCDRSKVEPLMDKALSPYVKGGGAKNYEAELKRMYGMEGGGLEATAGGFQAMTQDALTVLNDIPFSIPPYFALLARAVVTLEGVALIGDPSYRLVMESYPFVARKLLKEDRPEVQRALAEVLYGGGAGSAVGESLRGARLATLLNSAMGVVAQTSEAFVDLETVPEEGVSLSEALEYALSPQAASLRTLLEDEAAIAADLLARQAARRAFGRAVSALPSPPLPFLPRPEDVPLPVLLPTRSTGGNDGAADGNAPAPVPALLAPTKLLDALAPPPSREEELYALSLLDLAEVSLGSRAATLLSGDALTDPREVGSTLLRALALAGTNSNAGDDGAGVPPQVIEVAQSLAELLAPDTESATSGGARAGGVALSSQHSEGASGSDGADENVRELAHTLRELNEEQRAALADFGSRIGARVYDKLVERALPLAGAGAQEVNAVAA